MAEEKYTHYRTCNLCEAMCGVAIEVEGEKILSIKGDPDDPFSQGHICPKALGLQDVYEDPDRLKQPLRRTLKGWEPMEWEAALDLVATKLRETQERYGRSAVGGYFGNPNVHNLGSLLVLPSLLRTLRTPNLFSATSVDQLPHHFAALEMFGHYFRIPVPDVDRTDFFLILGANPLASNGSLMTAGGIGRRLKAIQERGGKIVVVDPRRTETAVKADRHLFIPPGRDVLLLLALLHTIFEEGLETAGELEDFTVGMEELRAIVSDFGAERVSPRLGIPAQEIRGLARDFSAAPTAVCYGRMGLSTQAFGGACQWLCNALNLVTGNLDRPGGAMFAKPAFDIVSRERRGRSGRWKSRVRGLPEFTGELPTACLTEEIRTPGKGQIRALLTIAGNPVLSTPGGGDLDQALPDLDFMVSIDIYLNETTRHADVILPPTTGLESDHYDVAFHALAVRNSAKYSSALFPAEEGRLHDWQIYRELARRLSTDEIPFDETNPMNLATPAQILDGGLRQGPYGKKGISLDLLKETPHGVDLGPLDPCFPEGIFTDDGKIHLVPTACAADLPRIRDLLEEAAPSNGFDLTLIGRRHLASNNSWLHNSARLVKGPKRCTVMMHPQDAENRGLENGQRVRVESSVGRIELPTEITENVMPGVVSIPHGWGHGRDGIQLRIASAHPGASINDLTDPRRVDALTGNAAVNGVPVRIAVGG